MEEEYENFENIEEYDNLEYEEPEEYAHSDGDEVPEDNEEYNEYDQFERDIPYDQYEEGEEFEDENEEYEGDEEDEEYEDDGNAPELKVTICNLLMNADRQFLVGYRTAMGVWCRPEGRLLGGETPEECALRSTFAKTGIWANLSLMTGHCLSNRNEELNETNITIFVATKYDARVHPPPQMYDPNIEEWRWVPYSYVRNRYGATQFPETLYRLLGNGFNFMRWDAAVARLD